MDGLPLSICELYSVALLSASLSGAPYLILGGLVEVGRNLRSHDSQQCATAQQTVDTCTSEEGFGRRDEVAAADDVWYVQ